MRVSEALHIDESELELLTTTASGPGGRHVNRSQTRVVLRWNLLTSRSLSEDQRALLLEKLGSRISREGVLQVAAEDHRSQARNRHLARERLVELVAQALRRPRRRRATKPTHASQLRRVDEKKRRGALKRERGRREPD